MRNVFLKIVFLPVLFSLFSFKALAEEEAETPVQPSSQYYELKPSFVANFGDPGITKLKFVKADISLRVTGGDALQAVQEHNALIRHQIVMILSKQTEETLVVAGGQDKLRQMMLEQVNKVIEEETGEQKVDDLLFTSFVIQR